MSERNLGENTFKFKNLIVDDKALIESAQVLCDKFFLEHKALKNQGYQYVVTMSQLCFNTAYLYTKKENSPNLALPRMISETALLGEVKTIAQNFLEDGSLPNILFIDVLVDTGFSLYKKVNNFICALIDEIQSKRRLNSFSELRKMILDHIYIHAIVEREGILLMNSDEMAWKLFLLKIDSRWNFYHWVKAMHGYIYNQDIAMTSSIISAFTKLSQVVIKSCKVWEEVKCDFQGENEEKCIFQSAYSFSKNMSKFGVIPFVRYYESEENAYFIPFVFHGNLNKHNIIQLFEKMKELMKSKGIFHFAKQMDNAIKENNRYVMSYYVQMAEMLINQIVLSCFLQDEFGEEYTKFEFDWEKISLNFYAEQNEWLKELCTVQWSYQDLEEIFSVLPKITFLQNTEEKKNEVEIFERSFTQAYKCRINHICQMETFYKEYTKIRRTNDESTFFKELIAKPQAGVIELEQWLKNVNALNWNAIQEALAITLYLSDIRALTLSVDYIALDEIKIHICQSEMISFLYCVMFENEWDDIRRVVSYCKYYGQSYDQGLIEYLYKKENAETKNERINLIGTALQNYPEAYLKIIAWNNYFKHK